MPDPAQIDFPEADTKALIDSLTRAARALNIPLGRAVRMAGNMLGRTLGTSTRLPKRDVKAKKRVVRDLGEEFRIGPQQVFEVISWRSGRRKISFVSGDSKSEVNKSRAVKIDKYGLAKTTWVRIASRVGTGGATGGATASAKKTAARVGRTIFRLRGEDPFITLENELSYAAKALEGGEQDATTAMARAARGLTKSADEQLRRRLLKA